METFPIRVQVIDLVLVLLFLWIYFRHFDDVRLVGGDVSVDYEVFVCNFVNPKMLCRLNISKKLMG